MTLSQVLEALIFAAPKPLATAELLAAVKASGESSELEAAQAYAKAGEDRVIEALLELQAELESSGRAFRLMEQATGWGFVTRQEYAPWVRKLFPDAKPARLSGPALETLAIIAYRQPVTRADIEAVRGVAVDGVMQVLLDRSLVRITGRADLPGRPLLYSTTGYFLEHFGLKTTQDLPNASELGRISLPKAPAPEEKAVKRKGKESELGPELPLDMPPQAGSQSEEGRHSTVQTVALESGSVQETSAEPSGWVEDPVISEVSGESTSPETGSNGLDASEQAESLPDSPPEEPGWV